MPALPVGAAPDAEVPQEQSGPDAGSWLAAVTALGLGILAGAMMVAGHAPWEGPEVLSLSSTHGIHEGDVLALVPVVVGAALAWWCLTRPTRRRG